MISTSVLLKLRILSSLPKKCVLRIVTAIFAQADLDSLLVRIENLCPDDDVAAKPSDLAASITSALPT